ncbi:DUF3429 domain-containing protein [Marinicella sediminis]|uniref:DUF3429 domain-containing protein n=1 Tax=Marinicella sediminis TaxID=1792834 RepID=A0ABV7JAS3_9GAMM|nr:DUF3429 domain-containing protein [Marinicella sediminis]
MRTPTLPHWLTYLGALPFVLALLIACYGQFGWSEFWIYEIRFSRFKSYTVGHTYGAVIVAFLGGIQWGISLQHPNDRQYFMASNVLALTAWFSLFMFASFAGVMMITLAFILALWIDRHAFQAGAIPDWFWQLRKRISLVVIAALAGLLLING